MEVKNLEALPLNAPRGYGLGWDTGNTLPRYATVQACEELLNSIEIRPWLVTLNVLYFRVICFYVSCNEEIVFQDRQQSCLKRESQEMPSLEFFVFELPLQK